MIHPRPACPSSSRISRQVQPPIPIPVPQEVSIVLDGTAEMMMALVRLPLAALFGLALALRPRRRNQGPRKVVVIQTQIMLAVVGAVIMLVVGNSVSAPIDVRTKDVSDTLKLAGGGDVTVRWEERRAER